MPARQVGVYRRSGSRSYYCHIYIPKHLQDAFQGKTSIVRSLGTTELAEANRRAIEARREMDAKFQALEAGQCSTTLETLTSEQIRAIAQDELAKALALDEQKRIDGLTPEQAEVRSQGSEWTAKQATKVMATGAKEVDLLEADLLLALRGFRVAPDSPSRKQLAFEMAKVKREVAKAKAERNQGEWVETPPRVENPIAAPAPSSRAVNGKTLEDMLEAYHVERKLTAQTLQDYQHKVRSFVEVNGLLPVNAYSKEHCLAFKNRLVEEGRPAKTINTKYLAFVGTVFRYAHANGVIPTNPMDGVKVMARGESTTPERAYTLADLKAIFSAPIFTKGERPKKWGRSKPLGEAVFWIPLLALFTGARQNELCQLEKADVVDYGDGRYYLSINMENGKKLKMGRKNVRSVPIHHELIRLGFLDYVAKQADDGMLFPELTRDERGKTNEQFSKWFNGALKDWGIKRAGINFHSFRHTFKDICRECGIDEAVHDALTGHRTTASVGRQYGSGQYPLPPLFKAMEHFTVRVSISVEF
ncbi:DUF6538 domain-containing protein [Paludibacterium denitrificans]|nr:DUF6538 domain-containing protein [Paludibacterium denitrificans]